MLYDLKGWRWNEKENNDTNNPAFTHDKTQENDLSEWRSRPDISKPSHKLINEN